MMILSVASSKHSPRSFRDVKAKMNMTTTLIWAREGMWTQELSPMIQAWLTYAPFTDSRETMIQA